MLLTKMESGDLNKQTLEFIVWEIPIFKSIVRHSKKQYGFNQNEAEHYAVNTYSGFIRQWYYNQYLDSERR